MNIIYINGKYLSQRITGVQRYAREIVNVFDCDDDYRDYTFKVICPENALIPEQSNRVEYIKIKGKGYYFEQFTLPKYLKHNKAKILLNLCNLAPMKFPGACVIHDLNLIDNKSFYSFQYRFIVGFIMRRNIKKYQPIYTVSNFSKSRIIDYYKIDSKKVITTYSGIKNPCDIQDLSAHFSFSSKPFYLTVGSFNKTKNMNYVLETAKRRPQDLFVITGSSDHIYKKSSMEKPENVIFTGYITDEELRFLYSKCKAFIFPSFYEGFGAPPLEAINYGCKRIILSDIEVFKEIYGETANYCNPYDVDTILSILDHLKELSKEERDTLLKKYQWKMVADRIFNGIKEQI